MNIHDWMGAPWCISTDEIDNVLWSQELGRMSDQELRRQAGLWGYPMTLAELARREALS